MKIFLATLGSRGDVEPFVHLARAAQRAGHEVRLVLPRADDVDVTGLEVAHLSISFADLAETRDAKPAAAMRAFRERIRPAMARALAEAVDLAVDWQPQTVVAHPKVLTAPVAASRLSIPWFLAELTPTLSPTREFPAAGIASRSLGPWLNHLSYRAVGLAGAVFRREVAAARRRHRVTGPSARPVATLAAFSPTLVPRPADWPRTTRQTGDWRAADAAASGFASREDRTRPDGALAAFLADPRPFLYAGFGSMTGGDPVRRADAIVAGARDAGLRVLLVTGWGGLDPARHRGAGDVLVQDNAPLGAILPRATVAVHHGGAGTVHTTTRAGTPSIVVPFFGDQPFWAAQLQRVGLAGPPLDPNGLTPARVAEAIGRAKTHAGAVADAAARMRTEHGAEAALRELAR